MRGSHRVREALSTDIQSIRAGRAKGNKPVVNQEDTCKRPDIPDMWGTTGADHKGVALAGRSGP